MPSNIQSQELPCGAVLIGMSGIDKSKITSSNVSSGTLTKFKECPKDSGRCDNMCFKWTPAKNNEPTFCFATRQFFQYDESRVLEDYVAFRHSYQFRPTVTDDFFWIEDNQATANYNYRNSWNKNKIWGINRIGESGYDVPGYLDCKTLGETIPAKAPVSLSQEQKGFASGQGYSKPYLPPRK